MKDKERMNRLIKRRIRDNFKECLSLYKKKKRVRRKGVRLFFKVLKKLESSGIHFGEPKEKMSFTKNAVSIDIYSLIPVYEPGFVESLLEKKISLILDMKDLGFKVKAEGKEIRLMRIKKAKKKRLISQIKATYKNIGYIKCW